MNKSVKWIIYLVVAAAVAAVIWLASGKDCCCCGSRGAEAAPAEAVAPAETVVASGTVTAPAIPGNVAAQEVQADLQNVEVTP